MRGIFTWTAGAVGKWIRLTSVVVAGAVSTGCSVHPLPDDVTRLSTYNIVRQIRCETREAVIDSMLRYLTDDDNARGIAPNSNEKKVDARSRLVGQYFLYQSRYGTVPITRFDLAMLSGFAKTVITLMWNTGIAYNYNLDMLETNNVDPQVNILRALARSTDMLGLTGSFDRQRQNVRSFSITDNFGDLVRNLNPQYCNGQIVEANMRYPIAGKIGMDLVVHDFMMLALFGNLSGSLTDPITVKGPPTMVDQLQFTTTIGGSVTPGVTFTPLGKSVHVADAKLALLASRTDTHRLTVGLYLAPPGVKEIDRAREGIFRGPPGASGSGVTFRALTTTSGGAAEQGAAAAVEQFLTQRLFQPNFVIQP